MGYKWSKGYYYGDKVMLKIFKNLFIKKYKIKIGDNIMSFNENQNYWAEALLNNEFLLIETLSGLGLVRKDHDVPSQILPLDADDKTIGESVLLALSRSRTIAREEYAAFFNLETGKNNMRIGKKTLCKSLDIKPKGLYIEK
jgi:hypothetical protein